MRRPEGTDGSDFSYREVIEDRYKRMAVNMSATLLLHQIASGLALLKVIYMLTPMWTDGGRVEPFAYVLTGLIVTSNLCFYAGKPRGRCVLPLMKVAALTILAITGMHVLSVWKYHMLDAKTQQISRRVYKHLRDNDSATKPWVLDALVLAESVLDAATFIGGGVCFFVFNNWVRDAMESVKERKQREAATAAAAAPIRAPPGARAGAPVRRRA
ncbi:hypothetical protein HYH03_012837 [Edaphochlamys debaryana]|uniref:Uncharacterized protein n=1 Tax=Edaphochlamys debaryana TaxID=47281 RepID=A0A835XUR5_9CHLO|nr:hypothetical protein HYH03_012837 [Edaphochlamys debaryana]|eukprot:KAG2488676.1 hypothetical protein HYH03_012837 [Edaphochlamys debaryana]